MSVTNGANNHNVDELLSSIRTSIGDDHGPMRPGPSSPYVRRDGARIAEENSEFELPAIFKPGHQAPAEKPGNLFGRLSDALKTPPAAEADRSRTVIRFEPAAGRMIEPPSAAATMPSPSPVPAAADPVEAITTENKTVKREMPSFFDTRLNKLGEMSRQAYKPAPAEPPRPVAPPQQLVPQPPPLRPAESVANGGMEDAAAQLLRPILKQWLTENMPKIVEKALRSEAGDDFPPQGFPPVGRKPG